MLKILFEKLFLTLHTYAAYLEIAFLALLIGFATYEYVHVQQLASEVAIAKANLQTANVSIANLQGSIANQNAAVAQYKQAADAYQADMNQVSAQLVSLSKNRDTEIQKILTKQIAPGCTAAIQDAKDSASALGTWDTKK